MSQDLLFEVVDSLKPMQDVESFLFQKLVVCMEKQSPLALTLHPVPLKEARAVLERVGRKVESLQQQLSDTKTDLSEIKEQILLGEAAYTFARLLENFVFDGTPTEQFQTLALKEYPSVNLTTEQQMRWEQVQDFATAYVGRGQLIKIDKMLRKGRFQLAHGEAKDKKRADLRLMEGWAAHYYQWVL
ncbi:hypothetical protein WJX79_001330 [Trebouxia sp. C0005]